MCKLPKGRVSRAGVYEALKHLKTTGSARPKAKSTPKRNVRTPKLITNTREMLERNLQRSIRKLVSEAGESYGTVQHVIKKDLKLSPYKKTKAQLLTPAAKTKRLQRAKLLLKNLRDGTQPPVMWTDEKLFTVQAVHNHQNGWIWAANKQGIPLNNRLMFQRQKPASVMVWLQLERKLPSSSLKKG